MRLIDADALENELIKTMRYVPKDAVLDVACMVNRAPTIEAKPVVHAHWDKDRCCTHCGRTYMDIAIAVWEDFSENEADIPSCCPYCGAQMDEKVEE